MALFARVKTSIGPYLQRRLRETFADHPLVGEVRGIGLLAAIELVPDKPARKLLSARPGCGHALPQLLLRERPCDARHSRHDGARAAARCDRSGDRGDRRQSQERHRRHGARFRPAVVHYSGAAPGRTRRIGNVRLCKLCANYGNCSAKRSSRIITKKMLQLWHQCIALLSEGRTSSDRHCPPLARRMASFRGAGHPLPAPRVTAHMTPDQPPGRASYFLWRADAAQREIDAPAAWNQGRVPARSRSMP